MSIHSLCTVVADSDWESLEKLLQSICVYNPFIPIFVNVTQKIKENIFSSELSDGRIQIKLNQSSEIECSTTIKKHSKIKEIISLALETYENTCYIDVNSFFCSDIKNIHFDEDQKSEKTYNHYANDHVYLSFQCNSLETQKKIQKIQYISYVDLDNATYDQGKDLENIIIFKSMTGNSESKFYNNYVNVLFNDHILKYYKQSQKYLKAM